MLGGSRRPTIYLIEKVRDPVRARQSAGDPAYSSTRRPAASDRKGSLAPEHARGAADPHARVGAGNAVWRRSDATLLPTRCSS